MNKKRLTAIGSCLIGMVLLLTTQAQAQNQTVTGVVTDSQTEETLPGVNVVVNGTTTGTSTGESGNYSLNVSSLSDTLRFTYVGYQTQLIPVDGRTTINVQLQSATIAGEELVVVGYGTRESSELTQAISTVEGEMVSSKGTVSAMQGLQGQIAGADISANSGRVGSEYNIQIRGQNSLAGGDPLFVVDGVIVDDIDFLNPQDIEKVNILKDAASTAVYGSRGSNGVVIVTTESGSNQSGETTISYEGYVGVRDNVRMPTFMNGTRWWEFRQDAYITDALQTGEPYDNTVGGVEGSALLAERLANNEYTDWPGYFLRSGLQSNNWISVSGEVTEGLRYVIGGGFQKEKGNLLGEHYDRYNFKGSVDHNINETWSAGLNFNMSFSERELGSEDAIRAAYRMSPLVAPYDSTGALLYQPAKYAGISFTSSVNPLWELRDSENNRRRTFGVGNVYLQFAPIEWLNVRSTFAPEFEFEREGVYFGPNTGERNLQDGSAELEKGQSISYTWDNQISAKQQFGDHLLDGMGLFSIYSTRYEGSGIEVANLPYKSLFYNLGTARDYNNVSSGFSKTTLLSLMGRVNYSYKNKYLLTVSSRWDGSSKLAEGHKWAMFPSASVGWRITQEDFFNVEPVSELKLRFSYGFTGNNNIDPYSTLPLSSRQTLYDFGGNNAKGFAPNGIVNRSLTWEKTREYDLGLDYELFNGRVSGSIDYYDKLADKLLLNRQLPMETGYGSLTDNIGSVSNNGIEIALNTLNISTNNFSWQTSFTFARNYNEIVSLYSDDEDDTGNQWFIGEPINVNYSYVFDGIWHADQADEAQEYGQSMGQARVRDFNDDGVINGDDRRIIGTPEPDWTGGFSTQVNFRQFDLSMSVYARQGAQVFSPFHQEFLDLNDRGRAKLEVPFFMPENDVTPARNSNSYPQPNNIGPYWDEVGSYKDASFVKVQNIALGYNFSPDLLNSMNFKSLRVYLNILNPFVWTDYTGFDPEWADSGLNESGNSFVTYQLGINLQL